MSTHTEIGAELETERTPAVDPEKMKLMAAILRDPNPIHFDPKAVAVLGLGDRVINQGPATLSYVADYAAKWAGGVDRIRSIDARMLGNVFAGESVDCGGTIAAIDEDAGTAQLELFGRVDGRDVVTATVVVILPLSSTG